MSTPPPLGPILTLAETAERLRMTNKRVALIARKHGIGALAGRSWLFKEEDLTAIWEACRENASPTVGRNVKTSSKRSKSDSAGYAGLLELARKLQQEKRSKRTRTSK